MGDPLEHQIEAALKVLGDGVASTGMLGIYLYGSAVAGGVRPDSDIDLLAVTRHRITVGEKRALIDRLIPISERATRPPDWRPLDLTIVAIDDLRPWRYPPWIDLQYGEWRRDEFEAGSGLDPSPSPDLAITLASVRESARALRGTTPTEILDPIPGEDLRRAMVDELPGLLSALADDTRNVLLTLARIWATMATGRIMSKADAATWVIERLAPEARAPIVEARDLYLRGGFGRWGDREAVSAAVRAIRLGIDSQNRW